MNIDDFTVYYKDPRNENSIKLRAVEMEII